MSADPTGPETPEEPTPARDGDVANLDQARAARNGKNVTDQVTDDGVEEEQPEVPGIDIFEFEEKGKKVSLSTLWNRGTAVAFEFKFEGRSVKGRDMQLVAFSDPWKLLLIEAKAGKVEADPTYAADGSIDKVTIRQAFKAVSVLDAQSEAARVRMAGEAVEV